MLIYDKELNIKDIGDLLFGGETINLGEEAFQRIERSYNFLKEFSKEKVIYGINTGFGPMSQFRVEDKDLKQLQLNLIRSHACGTGNCLQIIRSRQL